MRCYFRLIMKSDVDPKVNYGNFSELIGKKIGTKSYGSTYRAMQSHLAGEQRHVVVGHGHVLRVQVRQELGADALVLGLQQHAVHAVLVRLHHHDAQIELALASIQHSRIHL